MSDPSEQRGGLVEALLAHKQCDEDGIMCIVSRQAVVEAAAALSENDGGWIAVSERLPKADEDVLFVDEHGVASVGCKVLDDADSKQWIDKTTADRDGDYLDTYTVTHWMPLPAAPTTEGEGD
jgi:hypothetical protein